MKLSPFEDYREMLTAVPDLDAVFVATPDFMHAEHTNACLKAGKHVYCEKLMSNTVEGARSMVRTARETKKLLQIGHQRRSNPRYLHARDKVVREARLLGRITNITGQWHRAVTDDFGFPKSQAIPRREAAQVRLTRTCTSSGTGAGSKNTPAAHLRSRRAPNRRLQLDARREPAHVHRERRRRLLQDPRVVRQRDRDLRVSRPRRASSAPPTKCSPPRAPAAVTMSTSWVTKAR